MLTRSAAPASAPTRGHKAVFPWPTRESSLAMTRRGPNRSYLPTRKRIKPGRSPIITFPMPSIQGANVPPPPIHPLSLPSSPKTLPRPPPAPTTGMPSDRNMTKTRSSGQISTATVLMKPPSHQSPQRGGGGYDRVQGSLRNNIYI